MAPASAGEGIDTASMTGSVSTLVIVVLLPGTNLVAAPEGMAETLTIHASGSGVPLWLTMETSTVRIAPVSVLLHATSHPAIAVEGMVTGGGNVSVSVFPMPPLPRCSRTVGTVLEVNGNSTVNSAAPLGTGP